MPWRFGSPGAATVRERSDKADITDRSLTVAAQGRSQAVPGFSRERSDKAAVTDRSLTVAAQGRGQAVPGFSSKWVFYLGALSWPRCSPVCCCSRSPFRPAPPAPLTSSSSSPTTSATATSASTAPKTSRRPTSTAWPPKERASPTSTRPRGCVRLLGRR